jgi:hypothetical protein
MSNGIGKHHAKNEAASKPVVKTATSASKPKSPHAEQIKSR